MSLATLIGTGMFRGKEGRYSILIAQFLILPVMVAALSAVTACTLKHDVITNTHTALTYPPPPPSTEGLALVFPTVGLFIGVSEYGQPSTMPFTPAHTLSAALLHQAFFDAATRSEQNSRKKALGIPASNYFDTHTKSVCAAAFSKDGTRFITGSVDGTVVIRRVDGSGNAVLLRSTDRACSVAFSRNGSLVVIGAGKAAMIFPSTGKGEQISLKHPADLWSAEFSPDGSRILTVAADGVIRVWPVRINAEPLVQIPAEECQGTDKKLYPSHPIAQFSPSGTQVASAACSDIRVWPTTDPRASKLLGRHIGIVNSVAFSPDGLRIVSTGPDVARIWSADGAKAQPLASNHEGVPTSAVFSSDGAHLAVGYSSGYAEVWRSDGGGVPVPLADRGHNVHSLEFSADGKYLLVCTDGFAWVQDVAAEEEVIEIPTLETGGDEFAKAQSFDTTHKYLPKYVLAVETAVFSPAGDRIVAGYSDGSVAIHPGVPPLKNPEFRADRLTVLADLQMNREEPTSSMALDFLLQLRGALPHLRVVRSKGANKDASLYRFGSGQLVTRDQIFKSLSHSIQQADAEAALHDRVLLVIYVAAHGWTAEDGRAYFLPADADANKPNTWISYEDFLKPVQDFVARDSDAHSPSSDSVVQRQKNAIVILDTCQIARNGELRPSKLRRLARPGLMILEGTSPGRYAWHWTATFESQGFTKVEKEARWGFPPPPKAKRGPIAINLSTTMSTLPLASQEFLNKTILTRKSISGSQSMILARDWFLGIKIGVDLLQEQIPEVREAARVGDFDIRQEVQLQYVPEEPDYSIFRVEPRTEKQ